MTISSHLVLRSLSFAVACLATPACAAALPFFSMTGSPSPLITDQQRSMLGLTFGPDAPIDFFQKKNGKFYINTSGGVGFVGESVSQGAFNLHVDAGLTRVLALAGNGPASGPADVELIMTRRIECGSGPNRLSVTEPGGEACSNYFDRDYAGGGTYFRCPEGGPSVYFYHGENHTTPEGNFQSSGGWFGIGVSFYDDTETAVSRAAQMPVSGGEPSAQIIGLDIPTRWKDEPGKHPKPPQAHPFNGTPSVIAGVDGYLYVFHGDATLDPVYNPSSCSPGCPGISRAPITAFCSAVQSNSPIPWWKYFQGGWNVPAVLGETPKGFGTGGPFTPLLMAPPPGEYGITVTFLPAENLFVMLRLSGGGIDARSSLDGMHWSDPQRLLDDPNKKNPHGHPLQVIYPRLSVVHDPQGNEDYVLTYMLVTKSFLALGRTHAAGCHCKPIAGRNGVQVTQRILTSFARAKACLPLIPSGPGRRDGDS